MTDYEMRKIAKYQNEYLVETLKKDDELLDLMYPPRYLDAHEAAELLRIPLSTLYQMVSELPHRKVGKKLVFSDRALTRWMNRQGNGEKTMTLKIEKRKIC